MANRTMQAKAMKLAKQRHAMPVVLDRRIIMTPDHAPARDCETGEIAKPRRYRRESVQRALKLFYAPAGEWTLYPRDGGKPARW